MLKTHPWTAALLVIAVSALAYLPLIDQLGLYLGDVTFMWIEQGLGAASLIEAISDDRPGAGVLFALTGALLGSDVLGWHLLMLLLRVGAALALMWGLRAVFPDHPGLTTAAGALMAVYPGFLLQHMAINLQTYLAAHLLALISIGASLRAVSAPRPAGLVGLSAVNLGVYLLLLEALIGLEALRLLLLWLHPSAPPKARDRLRWAARQMLPLLFVIGLFGVWRVFIFDDNARPDTDIDAVLGQYGAGGVALMLENWARGIWHGGALAWVQPLIERAAYLSLPLIIPAAGAAILIGALRPSADRITARRWLLIGALALIGALLPIAAVLKPPTLIPYSSRLLLPASAGAILLAIGLAALLPNAVRRIALGGLIGVSALIQLTDAALYADHWAMQRDFWRQMRDRVPAVADGATVIAVLPERWRTFPYTSPDDEILFPINWMLTGSAGELRHGGMILRDELIPLLTAGRAYDLVFRSGWLSHRADLSRAVIVWLPETGDCLRVLSPNDTDLTDPLIAAAAPFSRPALIIADAPPPDLPSWLGSADGAECVSG